MATGPMHGIAAAEAALSKRIAEMWRRTRARPVAAVAIDGLSPCRPPPFPSLGTPFGWGGAPRAARTHRRWASPVYFCTRALRVRHLLPASRAAVAARRRKVRNGGATTQSSTRPWAASVRGGRFTRGDPFTEPPPRRPARCPLLASPVARPSVKAWPVRKTMGRLRRPPALPPPCQRGYDLPVRAHSILSKLMISWPEPCTYMTRGRFSATPSM